MAKQTLLSIGVTISGDGTTTTYVPPASPLTNNAAPSGGPIRQALAAGTNTLIPPATATGLLIVPDKAGIVAMTLQGAAADIGIILSRNRPTFIAFEAPGANILINAAPATVVDIFWI